ncbi:MAG: methyltransferase [Candidatus Saccharibacteria bacterium]
MSWLLSSWKSIIPWIAFVFLYVATFKLAWRKLADLVVSNATRRHGVISWKFWWEFIYYRLILLLPYLPLFVFREHVPTTLLKVIFWWIVLVAAMGTLRFIGSDKIVKALWWVYGYMYDGLLNFYPYRNLVQSVIQQLDLENGMSLLEVGCGTGNVIIAALNVNNITARGVDSSKSMIRQANRKLRKINKSDSATVDYSDAYEFMKKIPTGSFDRISMVNFLYAVPNRTDIWRECLRILKPEGRIVVTTSTDGGSKPIIQEHLHNAPWVQLLSLRLVGVVIIDYFISELAKAGPFDFPKQEILLREVEEAGGISSKVSRVYGGSDAGVNIIFSVKSTQR